MLTILYKNHWITASELIHIMQADADAKSEFSESIKKKKPDFSDAIKKTNPSFPRRLKEGTGVFANRVKGSSARTKGRYSTGA